MTADARVRAIAVDRPGPVEVTLRDGSVVTLRRVVPADEPAIRGLFEELSLDSRALRFMTAGADLDGAAAHEARAADRGHLGLLAARADRVLGVGSYEVVTEGVAEVAFAVADDAHGQGVGTLLLGALADEAQRAGIARFEALVLPENHAMTAVFRDSGFPVQTTSEPGLLHLEMPTELSAQARERFECRETLAAVAGVRHFLAPASVAVIGASARRGGLAGELTRNLLASGFPGTIHLVNPHGGTIEGRPVQASIAEVTGEVELAVIVVPAPQVLNAARACAAGGVRALVVVSAGFAESGPAGAARQRKLLDLCRGAGMRLVGPNCMGAFSVMPGGVLNATFAPHAPLEGSIGLASQSGGLGLAAIEQASELGAGLSALVSLGNRADISSNDLLQFWAQDPRTTVALLYLESFGRPRSFARIARRVTRTMPVVAVRAGRTQAGARAAASHTGALVTASDLTVDALFRQAGVTRVDTGTELLEVGALLAALPLPAGPRVGIVANAGGLGIMAADACEGAGLEVPELSQALRTRLAEERPDAAVANPVDLLPAPAAATFRAVIERVASSGEVDAVLAIYARPHAGADPAFARELVALAADRPSGLPVVPVVIGEPRPAASEVPVFRSPESAVRALAHAWEHRARRDAPADPPPELRDVRADAAAAIVARSLEAGGGWLGVQDTLALLACYGIPVADARVAPSAHAAAAAARELGGPVALKAIAPALLHKSDAGGVRTGLAGPTAVRRAARDIRRSVERAGHRLEGFVVQRMAEEGVELLVGVVNDDLFGPVVACGAGGTTAELLRDVAVRLAPLGEREATGMLRSLRTFPLLEGYRGSPRVDIEALERLLVRVGALADAHPALAEMDLNPVIASPAGVLVVDARVRISPEPGPPA